MGVDFLYCGTKHEATFSVELDKDELEGDQGGHFMYYVLKTGGISLEDGSCYPMDIQVQDNLNCSQFGFKIYGVTDVKVKKVSVDGIGSGAVVSFLNGEKIKIKAEDYDVKEKDDHCFVKCDLRSKINSYCGGTL